MREVAGTGEVHGDTSCFSGSNNFFIADGAAGLDNGGNAGIDKHLQAIGEWEERIRCCDGTASTLCGISQSIRAVNSQLRRINAVDLAHTHANGCTFMRQQDGVGLYQIGRASCRERVEEPDADGRAENAGPRLIVEEWR